MPNECRQRKVYDGSFHIEPRLDILHFMTIDRLSQVSHADIHAAFTRAFSDYHIPVKETLQEMAVANMQRDIDYDASFGSFADDGELVGFIL